MTWVAWRQFRAQGLTGAAALVAVLAVLLATRPHLASAVHLHGVDAISHTLSQLRLIGTGLIAAPALIGAFCGAPLVARELEAGTHRLAWTQSRTRTRWLLVRVGVVTAISAVLVGAFSLAFTWWSKPLDGPTPRFGTAEFGQRGIAPVGYVVFAIALGVLLGVLLRRTLAAMAATLVGFLVARMLVQSFVRPHLVGAVELSRPTSIYGHVVTSSAVPTGWVLSSRTVDRTGHTLAGSQVDNAVARACHLGRSNPTSAYARCADRIGVHDIVRVIPSSRFWALQAAEAALFVVVAVGLIALAAHRLERQPA